MAEGEFKHTDAAEQEAFLGKTQASQLLEIWLNGRETNGHVAEAFRQIAAQGREMQKMWVSLSDHLEAEEREEAALDFIKRWGARGTGLVLFALAVLGGIEAVVLIIQR